MNHHLNRKNVCKPLLEDMDIIDVKMYYGFKLQTKKAKITSNETKCDTTTTDSSSEYSDISDTESDDTTFLPQNYKLPPKYTNTQNPPKSTKIHQNPPHFYHKIPQIFKKPHFYQSTKINQCKIL